MGKHRGSNPDAGIKPHTGEPGPIIVPTNNLLAQDPTKLPTARQSNPGYTLPPLPKALPRKPSRCVSSLIRPKGLTAIWLPTLVPPVTYHKLLLYISPE